MVFLFFILTCNVTVRRDPKTFRQIAIRQQAQPAAQHPTILAHTAVIDIRQPYAGRELVAHRGGVLGHGAVIRTAVQLDAHADGAWMDAVRQKAHFARHGRRIQVLDG